MPVLVFVNKGNERPGSLSFTPLLCSSRGSLLSPLLSGQLLPGVHPARNGIFDVRHMRITASWPS
jgi:hypothetical protein